MSRDTETFNEVIDQLVAVRNTAKTLTEQSERVHNTRELSQSASTLEREVEMLHSSSRNVLTTLLKRDGLYDNEETLQSVLTNVVMDSVDTDVQIAHTIFNETREMKRDVRQLVGHAPKQPLYEYGLIGDEIWSKTRRIASAIELTGVNIDTISTENVAVEL